MNIKTILNSNSDVNNYATSRKQLDDLPEWDLSDLYISSSAKEINTDLALVKIENLF